VKSPLLAPDRGEIIDVHCVITLYINSNINHYIFQEILEKISDNIVKNDESYG